MIGLLLLNLGTPDAPTEEAVRRYLDVFLSDPYVITLPTFLRNFLVQKIILPRRPKKTAHAYQQVWTPEGSPLLTNSIALKNALSKKLKSDFSIALGMRYENPSIESALQQLQKEGCEQIIMLPLFPQYCHATTQSAIDHTMLIMKKLNYNPTMHIIPHFYREDFYIHSVARIIESALNENPTDFLLLSYHGLPKNQIDPNNNYQAQCLETSERIAKTLNLSREKYETTFQSRLGLTKWIGPYTDKVIMQLRKNGVKKISVACPSFVSDCLETLEEINMRLREQWMSLGGEYFELIPCLNADEQWVDALAEFVRQQRECFTLTR